MIKPNAEICHLLQKAKKFLISLDNDEAGAKASWQWWMNIFPNAIRWPVFKGKDHTEAYLNGLNLKDWVKVGIQSKRQTPISSSPVAKVSPDPESIMKILEQLKDSSMISMRKKRRSEEKSAVPKPLMVGLSFSSMTRASIW